MRKIILFLVIGIIFLYSSEKDEYLEYTNKLVNYHFELKGFDKLKSPFYKPEKKLFINNLVKNVKEIIHISLLSVFNDLAYVKIEIFRGDELSNTYKKWVKKGEKIQNCKVKEINIDKIILQCGNQILVKTLNPKSINIKVEK
jgi:hypothetical protein